LNPESSPSIASSRFERDLSDERWANRITNEGGVDINSASSTGVSGLAE